MNRMPLKSKIATFRAGLPQAIDQGVDDTADAVVTSAQAYVPELTGALKTSIEKFGAGGTGERTVEAGQSLGYAEFVEYGGKGKAQPFMTPAAEDNRPLLPKNVGARIKALEGKSRV
jgi:hypothetical protein